jgi:Ca2+/Na+ antiporter
MRVIAVCLVILLAVFAMSLDVILAALPLGFLKVTAIVGVAILFLFAFWAVLCAMLSSKISQEEERERGRNPLPETFKIPKVPPPAPPKPDRDYEPHRQIWS